MNKQGRSQLALGVILILLGGWFLLNQTMPQFRDFFAPYTEWPVNMLLIGAGILVIGLVTASPGLAVPAAIVAGIGGIFYYQKMTESYDSWSYMWALIPGFIGVGTILQGLLGENTGHNLKRGLNLIVVSAVLFIVFAAFLGGWNILGNYGPAALLILLGLYVLGSGLFRSFRKREE
ncbi:MAG TPA: hypothetical protein PK078_03145 [Anaerolineales bacterium]|nr:hypothetical protein [Anaerolineales bacterium]HNB35457.1 hypothetical protein [Anaerolineales bacterium]HNC07244.1 hypothetical protein [Anaerolineales bacterium]